MSSALADPNMDTIYYWARSYPNKPILSKMLWNAVKRAEFLDYVDNDLIAAQATWKLDSGGSLSFKNNIELKTSTQIYDVVDAVDRFVLTGVLWAGCLDAAKATSENLTDSKRLDWSNKIDRRIPDYLYIQGVEAGPILRKVIRNQPIYTNGIPTDSILMRYAKALST